MLIIFNNFVAKAESTTNCRLDWMSPNKSKWGLNANNIQSLRAKAFSILRILWV